MKRKEPQNFMSNHSLFGKKCKKKNCRIKIINVCLCTFYRGAELKKIITVDNA